MSLLVQIALGLMVGIFSGLLGVGGGLLGIPALLYIYPHLVPTGDPLAMVLSMKTATGIAAITGLGGSFSASITHYLNKNAHLRLMLFIAIGTMTGSYLGSYTSGWYSNLSLQLIYVALLLFIVYRHFSKKAAAHTPETDDYSLPPMTPAFTFRLGGMALLIGYLSGLLGIGGAVLLIPLMVHFLGVPVRLSIGSTSGIVFLSAITMVIGKLQADLIPLPWGAIFALSALPGGIVGALLSKRFSEKALHGLLVGLAGLTIIRIMIELALGNPG